MSALAFVFRPAWVAAINFAHVLALVLAVGGAALARAQRHALATVVLLAALAWPAGVAVSVWISAQPAVAAAGPALRWGPWLAALPLWLALVVGIRAAWRR